MRLRNVLVAAMLLVVVAMAPAQAAEWEVDKAHSAVYFDVKHILSTVRGAFMEYDGTVNFDPANPDAGSFMFTIKVGSVDTGISKRDNHLRSKDFFDAGKHPEIVFKSRSIKPDGEMKYILAGDMTIKGKTFPMELPMMFLGVVDHPLQKGKKVAGFDFRFPLDRLEYGVGSGKFYEMGVVGKDVDLFVTLEVLSK